MFRFSIAILALVAVLPACSQTLSFDRDRVPILELAGNWRFQQGDDPGWSNPGLNDSTWPVVRAERIWPTLQSFATGEHGVEWYRFRVQFTPTQSPLALLIPALHDSYQVFVNGTQIGQVGGMPPRPRFIVSYNQVFSIPTSVLRFDRPNVVAFRVWVGPRLPPYYIPHTGPWMPYLGEAGHIQKMQSLLVGTWFWSRQTAQIVIGANLITALLGFGLFLATRRDREYLWFGIAQTFWSVQMSGLLALDFGPFDYTTGNLMFRVGTYFAQFCELEFFLALLKQRRNFIYWIAVPSMAAAAVNQFILAVGGSDGLKGDVAGLISGVSFALSVWTILLQGARAGGREARILLVPYSLNAALAILELLVDVFGPSHVPLLVDAYRVYLTPTRVPFPIGGPLVLGLLKMAAICVVLVWRFGRTRHDEERMHMEFEAARVLQNALIPEEWPAVPGFTIEAVYKPAGQVGGDFFQVLPGRDNSTLIAVGDVSGKGLAAAMNVAVLVGALRTVAEYTTEPADILAALNHRLTARKQGGFTTCLVLRIDADGTVVMASAGHIPPYFNSKELTVESGLPLGITDSVEYFQRSVRLAPDDRLTLVTDGVVEAKNARGELLGFEQTARLSSRRPEEIAMAAQDFGQQDDITVLTIVRVAGAEVPLHIAEASV